MVGLESKLDHVSRKDPQGSLIEFRALMQSEAARLLEADLNDAYEIGEQFKDTIRAWYGQRHRKAEEAVYDSVRSWRALIFSAATTKIFDKSLRRVEEHINGGNSFESLLETVGKEPHKVSDFVLPRNNARLQELKPVREYIECMSTILEPEFEEFMRECGDGGSLQRFGEALEAATKISPAVLDRWYTRFIHEIEGRSRERVYTRDEFAGDLVESGRASLISTLLATVITGAALAYPYHFVTYDMDAEEKLKLYRDFIPRPGLSGLSFWSRRQLNKLLDPFWEEVHSPSPRLRIIKEKALVVFGIGIDDVGDPTALRRALYRRQRPRSPRRCPAPNIPLAPEILSRLTGHVAPGTLWKAYPGLFVGGGTPTGEIPVGAATNDTHLESMNPQRVARRPSPT